MAYIFPLRIHMISGLFNNKIFMGEAYSNIWFLKVTFCTCRRVTCWRQIRWYKNKNKKGQLVLTHIARKRTNSLVSQNNTECVAYSCLQTNQHGIKRLVL